MPGIFPGIASAIISWDIACDIIWHIIRDNYLINRFISEGAPVCDPEGSASGRSSRSENHRGLTDSGFAIPEDPPLAGPCEAGATEV